MLHSLIQRETHAAVLKIAEIDLSLVSANLDLCLTQPRTDLNIIINTLLPCTIIINLHLDSIKEHRVLDHVAVLPEPLGQEEGRVVYLPGDVLEPLGPVIHGEHGRDVGQQGLGRADVTGGLVPPDVLLPDQ